VLSHQTPIGWNPKGRLNAGDASSFSLWAITIVASASSNATSPRSVPATFDAGSPPGNWAQTCRRTCARALDLLQPAGRHLVQGKPHRRRRRDRTEHTCLVSKDVDVSDRLTAIGEHYRDVSQDPAAVLPGHEVPPGHRLGQFGRDAGPVGQEPGPALPAWATTPTPSPVTGKPDDHEVRLPTGCLSAGLS
jgi:hypothetical protein